MTMVIRRIVSGKAIDLRPLAIASVLDWVCQSGPELIEGQSGMGRGRLLCADVDQLNSLASL